MRYSAGADYANPLQEVVTEINFKCHHYRRSQAVAEWDWLDDNGNVSSKHFKSLNPNCCAQMNAS
jgi:hypothetical protein